MQNEDALKLSIANSPDWSQAVADFITCSTQIGQPFTSGHITTILRVYRPEFVFRHAAIGERVQDMFFNGEIVFNGMPAVQMPRVCAGLGRTPAGTTVFTYAADQQDADNFPFEIDIPKPNAGLKVMPTEHPIQPGSTVPPMLPAPADMKATVHADKRLCLPRAALEALVHSTGRTIRRGDEVWVRFEDSPERAFVSLDQKPTAVQYDITASRGRVLFPKAGSGQFNHGDMFAVSVVGDELVVDISKAL
jgi:hypothetical protein